MPVPGILLAAFVTGTISLWSGLALWADDAADMGVVRGSILAPFLAKKIDEGRIDRLLKSMRPDGSWPDIDYADANPNDWKVPKHLVNVSALVQAHKSPKSLLRDNATLKQAAFASLDYWLAHDFRNPNWWHNDIGVPQVLGPVLLLLDDELSTEQRSKGIAILRRGKLGMTGQNLVWLAEITLMRGILEGDVALVDSAFKRVADEILITTEEGIQPDFSFHQHGACLYNHGYGADFAVDGARLAGLAAGTRFAFSPEKTALLARYVLDGSQWMAYGSVEDYGADGREIVRPRQTAGYLLSAANNLLHLPTGREAELNALKTRLANRAAAPLEGNRCFWCSDFMTHLRARYYTSVRMHSTRVLNTDGPHNGEGIKSHYIADGCNFLLVSGREYDDIFPVWNWQQIPGTTVEQTGFFTGNPNRKGTTDFVGGVSDGRYGVTAFDFERDTLRARKAWFFFDGAYVCLGAGIACDSRNPVFTTLNQCYLRGNLTVFGTGGTKELDRGEHRLKSPVTIHHDNVAYVIESKGDVVLRNTSQEGSWHAISRSVPEDVIARDVFALCLDHGQGPRDGAYAYAVYPGVDNRQAKRCAKHPDVAVLCNRPDVQAVTCHALKLTQIVFYRPGLVAVAKKATVEANEPCLLMIQYVDDGIRLSVGDPTQKLQTIEVKLSIPLRGDGVTYDPGHGISTIPIILPTGPYAGQGVVRTFEVIE